MRSHQASGRLEGYNAGAMILHWAIALAILFQLAIGFAMIRLDLFPRDLRFTLIQWHKTVGLTVLALTLARIAWRLFNPPPAHPPMPKAEKALAGLVHGLFYVLMLAVPLSGWVLVSASSTKIPTLLMLSQALPWPNLPLPAGLADASGRALAERAHMLLAYSFVLLIGLHLAGAIKHALIDRAPSFSRMLPVGGLHRQQGALIAIPVAAAAAMVFLGGGVLAGRESAPSAPKLAGAAAPAAAPAASAPAATGWVIDKPASHLGYSVTFSGKSVAGTVDGWNAAITFDPDNLASARAEVEVDTGSITIDDAFIRSNLAGADGLDVSAFPKAKIMLTEFARTETGYLAKGTLTLKSITAPITLPFTFTEAADGTATVTGTADLDRATFKLGQENDAKGEWLAPVIKVELTLKARRSGAGA
ncbi:hypothetical protein BJF93_12500 [Xaviernesmea oryzae]|uniref:Lipid/polyisoprenoid-binding YceI-like domain-containing protein n=1 Tax=Xaviernesmea oryzae TaxID=464029 RepID=A0A1Q9B3I7_9HYPH|nr:cytochrome b/b6 domain-containing protein [Xaviernesmea oryzae]OLP62624.1 hypothetical protein BJF93_12500 [Xaviernesmea oryzae]SEM25558.1 cytochrome b561 [Xaviernesmea oryzae]